MTFVSARRLTLRAVAYLGFGSVAAALVVAAIAFSPGPATKLSTSKLDGERLQSIWHRYRHEDWPVQDASDGIETRYRGVTHRFAAHYLSGDDFYTYSVIEYSFGWPFRCFDMAATVVLGGNKLTESDRNCLHLVGVPFLAPSSEVYIPLRPIVPGLFANAVLYGLAGWLLAATLARVRRTIRRQRGQYENCGYRRLELETCPECGRLARDAGSLTRSCGGPAAAPRAGQAAEHAVRRILISTVQLLRPAANRD